MYKTKLPFILVFNKTDAQPHGFALEWMQDFEAFQLALASHPGSKDSEGEPTYMNSLMNSMSLVLDEFYKHLKVVTYRSSQIVAHNPTPLQAVGVSSMTGDGIKEFFEAVEESRETYTSYVLFSLSLLSSSYLHVYSEYLPELERARAARDKSLQDAKEDSMNRLMKDLAVDRAKNPSAAKEDRWESDEEDEDEDLDVNIIDQGEYLSFFLF